MKKSLINVPNALTLFRALCILPIALCILWKWYLAGFILLVLAGISDILDGLLAKTWQITTAFGAWFDTITDKILVFVSLLALYSSNDPLISTADFLWITSRESVIILTRFILKRFGMELRVNMWGKIKFWVQVISLLAILVHRGIVAVPRIEELIWLMKWATIISGLIYLLETATKIFATVTEKKVAEYSKQKTI